MGRILSKEMAFSILKTTDLFIVCTQQLNLDFCEHISQLCVCFHLVAESKCQTFYPEMCLDYCPHPMTLYSNNFS